MAIDDWTLDLVLTVVIGMRILRRSLHVLFVPSLCGERVFYSLDYYTYLHDFAFR